MLYKQTPFIRLTVSLIAGILFASKVNGLPIILLLIIATAIVLFSHLITTDRKGQLFHSLAIFMFFFSLGYVLYIASYKQIDKQIPIKDSYTLLIDDEPEKRAKSIKIVAVMSYDSLNNFRRKGNKIVVYFPLVSSADSLSPGDIITAKIKPQLIHDFDENDNFDYARYMLLSGFRYYSFCKGFATTSDTKFNFKYLAIKIRNTFLQKYSKGISNKQSFSIVSALTLGYKASIDAETRRNFQDAGISHIMAVSGLHVGIVSLIITSLLRLIRIKKGFIALIITLLGIWIFALIAGMTSSILRSSLMFTILYMGIYSGRNVHPINSLFASAFVILLLNPLTLFSAGFQLSYAAVLSILLFFRRLNRLFEFSGIILSKAWSLTSVSIIAQLGTMPFVLYHFRRLPLLSVVSNLFAIPLAFMILITGFLFLATPAGFFLSDLFAQLIEYETMLLFSIADFVASIPGTIINV